MYIVNKFRKELGLATYTEQKNKWYKISGRKGMQKSC